MGSRDTSGRRGRSWCSSCVPGTLSCTVSGYSDTARISVVHCPYRGVCDPVGSHTLPDHIPGLRRLCLCQHKCHGFIRHARRHPLVETVHEGRPPCQDTCETGQLWWHRQMTTGSGERLHMEQIRHTSKTVWETSITPISSGSDRWVFRERNSSSISVVRCLRSVDTQQGCTQEWAFGSVPPDPQIDQSWTRHLEGITFGHLYLARRCDYSQKLDVIPCDVIVCWPVVHQEDGSIFVGRIPYFSWCRGQRLEFFQTRHHQHNDRWMFFWKQEMRSILLSSLYRKTQRSPLSTSMSTCGTAKSVTKSFWVWVFSLGISNTQHVPLECRCDDRLKKKSEKSTRLTYIHWVDRGTGTPKDEDLFTTVRLFAAE
jgi:hypothetical protein